MAIIQDLDSLQRKRRARAVAKESLAPLVIVFGDAHSAMDVEAVLRGGEASLLPLHRVVRAFFPREGPAQEVATGEARRASPSMRVLAAGSLLRSSREARRCTRACEASGARDRGRALR